MTCCKHTWQYYFPGFVGVGGSTAKFIRICTSCGDREMVHMPRGSGQPTGWQDGFGKAYREHTLLPFAQAEVTTDMLRRRDVCTQADEDYKAKALRGEKEFYIIWQPESQLPPKAIFTTHEIAMGVADEMALRHEVTFFVMKAVSLHKIEKPITRKIIKG